MPLRTKTNLMQEYLTKKCWIVLEDVLKSKQCRKLITSEPVAEKIYSCIIYPDELVNKSVVPYEVEQDNCTKKYGIDKLTTTVETTEFNYPVYPFHTCLGCHVILKGLSDIRGHVHRIYRCKYYCKDCNKQFNSKKIFYMHVFKHSIKNKSVTNKKKCRVRKNKSKSAKKTNTMTVIKKVDEPKLIHCNTKKIFRASDRKILTEAVKKGTVQSNDNHSTNPNLNFLKPLPKLTCNVLTLPSVLCNNAQVFDHSQLNSSDYTLKGDVSYAEAEKIPNIPESYNSKNVDAHMDLNETTNKEPVCSRSVSYRPVAFRSNIGTIQKHLQSPDFNSVKCLKKSRSVEDTFSCDLCPRRFTSRQGLDNHKILHSDIYVDDPNKKSELSDASKSLPANIQSTSELINDANILMTSKTLPQTMTRKETNELSEPDKKTSSQSMTSPTQNTQIDKVQPSETVSNDEIPPYILLTTPNIKSSSILKNNLGWYNKIQANAAAGPPSAGQNQIHIISDIRLPYQELTKQLTAKCQKSTTLQNGVTKVVTASTIIKCTRTGNTINVADGANAEKQQTSSRQNVPGSCKTKSSNVSNEATKIASSKGRNKNIQDVSTTTSLEATSALPDNSLVSTQDLINGMIKKYLLPSKEPGGNSKNTQTIQKPQNIGPNGTTDRNGCDRASVKTIFLTDSANGGYIVLESDNWIYMSVAKDHEIKEEKTLDDELSIPNGKQLLPIEGKEGKEGNPSNILRNSKAMSHENHNNKIVIDVIEDYPVKKPNKTISFTQSSRISSLSKCNTTNTCSLQEKENIQQLSANVSRKTNSIGQYNGTKKGPLDKDGDGQYRKSTCNKDKSTFRLSNKNKALQDTAKSLDFVGLRSIENILLPLDELPGNSGKVIGGKTKHLKESATSRPARAYSTVQTVLNRNLEIPEKNELLSTKPKIDTILALQNYHHTIGTEHLNDLKLPAASNDVSTNYTLYNIFKERAMELKERNRYLDISAYLKVLEKRYLNDCDRSSGFVLPVITNVCTVTEDECAKENIKDSASSQLPVMNKSIQAIAKKRINATKKVNVGEKRNQPGLVTPKEIKRKGKTPKVLSTQLQRLNYLKKNIVKEHRARSSQEVLKSSNSLTCNSQESHTSNKDLPSTDNIQAVAFNTGIGYKHQELVMEKAASNNKRRDSQDSKKDSLRKINAESKQLKPNAAGMIFPVISSMFTVTEDAETELNKH